MLSVLKKTIFSTNEVQNHISSFQRPGPVLSLLVHYSEPPAREQIIYVLLWVGYLHHWTLN